MNIAESILELIKAHLNGNNECFKNVIKEIADCELKHGYDLFAWELYRYAEIIESGNKNVLNESRLHGLISKSMPDVQLSEFVAPYHIHDSISRILLEYRNRKKLSAYGLKNKRKIFIEGYHGTGKTFTASVIASNLNLPLYTVEIKKIISANLNEAELYMSEIFNMISAEKGIYLFDDFDIIASGKSRGNNVADTQIIINWFLQLIENDASESIIIVVTNNPKISDASLLMKFDEILQYSLPAIDEIRQLLEQKICRYDKTFIIKSSVLSKSLGLSHSQIIKICDDAIKNVILSETENNSLCLERELEERLSDLRMRESYYITG